MPPRKPVDPGPAAPDQADWTWVLTRACPDCGFDAPALGGARSGEPEPDGIPRLDGLLADASRRYAAVLGRADVADRPAPGVWAPLEYACHVRDVCDVMRARVEQILEGAGGPVRFADWDQDAAAVESAYWASDPVVVREQVVEAFALAADAWHRPVGAQWGWSAERSNGSRFTTRTLGLYFLHDIHHHLWDVNA